MIIMSGWYNFLYLIKKISVYTYLILLFSAFIQPVNIKCQLYISTDFL